MVRAWYMKNLDEGDDQRQELRIDPPQDVSVQDLFALTGVETFYMDPATCFQDGSLMKLRQDRNYSFEDCVEVGPETLADYETKIKDFFKEHLHTDEEIRFVVDGSGYFDVRDKKDRWIRLAVTPGDLVILPSGIYHRFTMDTQNYIKAMRYFVGEPVWKAHNRPEADHTHKEVRQAYLQQLDNV